MTLILTLPGSIHGLLRRGSPVFYRDEESSWTVLWIDGDEGCAAPVGEVPLGLWGMGDDFALDLTDATGRAHAAWWLAANLPAWARPAKDPTSAAWVGCLSTDGGADSRDAGHAVATLRYDNSRAHWYRLRGPDPISDALRHLDPDDPRTLPDGSRWVDAEALRRICLHVAGVAND